MSWEAWGTPDDPEPNPCAMCDNELGSSTDCKLCNEFDRAEKAESALLNLKIALAHRLRIMRTRSVYEGGKKDAGVSVEMLMAMTLLEGIPGVLQPGEIDARLVAESENALLTFDNATYIYAPRAASDPLTSAQSNDGSESAVPVRELMDKAKSAAGEIGTSWTPGESAVSAPSARELLEANRYRWLRDVARGVDWSEYISPTAYAYRCRTSAKEMDDSIDFAIRAHLGDKNG